MNPRTTFVLITIAAFVLGLLVVGALDSFPTAQKITLSNLTIDHSFDWSGSVLGFAVKNDYTSPIASVDLNLNQVDYGNFDAAVSPGEAQNESLALQNLIITSAKNYTVELDFVFVNGQHQDFNQTILPPNYVGAAFIDSESLNIVSSGASYFLTISNTGTIPIDSLTYATGNFQSTLSMTQPLMPRTTAVFDNQPVSGGMYQSGSAYVFTIQVTYSDNSTSYITSLISAEG